MIRFSIFNMVGYAIYPKPASKLLIRHVSRTNIWFKEITFVAKLFKY